MARRLVYKDGKEFACQHSRQVNEMVEQGWSKHPDQPSKKVSAKSKKKSAKVKAQAEVIPTDSPFNDGEPINIDQADTNTED